MNLIKYSLLILIVSNLYCQDSKSISLKKNSKIGIYYGYGYSTGLIKKKLYVYEPSILIIEFQKNKYFFKNNYSLDYLISAEYNAVKFNELVSYGIFEKLENKDIGLNFSCSLLKKINSRVDLYVMLGTGPHYLFEKLYRQSKGLIFSDNLGIGTNVKFKKDFFLDFRFGLRHLSNAGTKYPNVAIENKILFFGLKKGL